MNCLLHLREFCNRCHHLVRQSLGFLIHALHWKTCLALFLTVSSAVCGWCQSDDFDDGDDAGWTHYDPLFGYGVGGTGIWSFPAGAYRIQAIGSLLPEQAGPGRAGSCILNADYAQFHLSVDLVDWDNNEDQLFGLLARAGEFGLGSTDAYLFSYATRTGRNASGELEILRVANERSAKLAGHDVSLDTNRNYRFVFTGERDQLKAQVFDLADLSTPVATLTATDSTYSSGAVGLIAYDNSPRGTNTADVTFDNFVANELFPALSVTLSVFGEIAVQWPNWASNHVLQSTSQLAPADWKDIQRPYLEEGAVFLHYDGVEGKERQFYRLIRTSP